MKAIARRVTRYLSRPRTGAGLLYVALALGILKLWLVAWLAAGNGNFVALLARGAPAQFPLWTLVSFLLCAWLAFVLLRRRPDARGMRRVLLIGAVHAAGALRFYDWGLLLLSVLPLFAILPAVLLPEDDAAPR